MNFLYLSNYLAHFITLSHTQPLAYFFDFKHIFKFLHTFLTFGTLSQLMFVSIFRYVQPFISSWRSKEQKHFSRFQSLQRFALGLVHKWRHVFFEPLFPLWRLYHVCHRLWPSSMQALQLYLVGANKFEATNLGSSLNPFSVDVKFRF